MLGIAVFIVIAAVIYFSVRPEFPGLEKIATRYENKPLGYKFGTEYFLETDNSKEELMTRFVSDEVEIDIFYDNFEDNPDITVDNYNIFGNKGVIKSKQFDLIEYTTMEPTDLKTAKKLYKKEHKDELKNNKELDDSIFDYTVMRYSREKIDRIDKDKNFYTTVSIPRSDKEVYTIMIKSEFPDVDYKRVLKGFKMIPKKGEPVKHKTESKLAERQFNQRTQDFIDRVFLNNEKKIFGIYEETMENPRKESVHFENLESIEEKLDYEFEVLLSYSTTTVFQDGFGPLKQKLFKEVKDRGKVLELTFSTFEGGPAIDKQDDKTLDVLAGKYDDFLKEYAENFKAHEDPILFRINNEMNGDWVSYCTFHLGKDPQLFIETYRYIHDFFEKEGVDNLIYVFNPNEKSFPDFSYNKYLAYYPGDDYVDVVGLTAYNTGSYYEGEKWRSFDEAYRPLYDEYDARFGQPFMITEFGSSSIGGDKVEWLKDMFISIQDYPKIDVAVFWNSTDWDEKDGKKVPARPYKIDENEETTQASKEGLSMYK